MESLIKQLKERIETYPEADQEPAKEAIGIFESFLDQIAAVDLNTEQGMDTFKALADKSAGMFEDLIKNKNS